MARPSATAALLLLLVLSLLTVSHCRSVAVAANHADDEPESTAAVAVSDENGLPSSNPTLPAEAGAVIATEEEEALPVEQQHGSEFLRLPSHRLHRHRRPCSLHRHLWWKRHHGVYRDAPLRFHYSGHGGDGERREGVSHLAIFPAEEVKPVAEPDPDRSLPDSDGEEELVASREPSSFADADERAAAVRAWKKEMLRRWFHFHFHHHGMHHHRLQRDEEEAASETESMSMKRFHIHHRYRHHDDEDEEKNMMRKRPRHAEAEHDEDSDDEDEHVEEMVRRFRKAIMRRKFGHGGRRFFHHDHRHRHHAEEAEKAGGDEQSGVMAWIWGLMNRF